MNAIYIVQGLTVFYLCSVVVVSGIAVIQFTRAASRYVYSYWKTWA